VTVPQFFPSREQNAPSGSSSQPHTFAVPVPPHVTPVPEHVPQEATDRAVLQLSVPVTVPQFLPSLVQNAVSVSAVHAAWPQTFAVPPPPHVAGAVHDPQETTVRLAPQLSGAVRPPQFFKSRPQNAASDSGAQPQRFAPPPPQVTPVPEQVPQLATVRPVPQLSAAVTEPQFFPRREQNVVSLSAVHPQTFAVLLPQALGEVHVPQEATVRLTPQLSAAVTEPQFLPRLEQKAASVSGPHPHTFTVPVPPHVTPVPEHVPQEATLRLMPQLSVPETDPQFFPPILTAQKVVSVSGVQAVLPQTFGVPPPLHESGAMHVPHEATDRAVPQLSVPVRLPQFFSRREQKAMSVSGLHPQTFRPPAAHVAGAVHVPQLMLLRVVPQLSAAVTLPQSLPRREQNTAFVSAVQPHTFATPAPPHVLGAVQPRPKLQSATVRAPLQLSVLVTLPQFFPSLVQNATLVSAVQPHSFAVPPPPHVPGALQVPQEATARTVPQLSVFVTAPQSLPSREQNVVLSSAVQLGGPHTLLAPQVCGAVQVPQEATVRLLPQLSAVVTPPQFLPSRPQNAASVSAVQPQDPAVPPPPQVTPVPEHDPHDATVWIEPQLSAAVTPPQVLPRRVQKAESVSAEHPHTFDPPPELGAAQPDPKLQSATVRAALQLSVPE
jgi:hypothetical protein